MYKMVAAPWGNENKPYLIAEIGSNHDGEKSRALELIKKAAAAGANAAKFQLFNPRTLVLQEHPAYATLDRLSTPLEWLPQLAATCKESGIDFSATPFDLPSVNALVSVQPAFIKIASSDITYVSLLRACASTGLPILLSTGMSTFEEVERALECLEEAGATEIALLHCVSMYPPAFSDMNLLAVPELHKKFGCHVGLSDHTPGSSMAIISAALGGMIVEKHVTDDRRRKGPDHPYALEFNEVKQLSEDLNNTVGALGDGIKGPVNDESIIRIKARRGLYAARDLAAGEVLGEDDIIALRPTAEINAEQVDQVIGKKLKNSLAEGSALPASLNGKN